MNIEEVVFDIPNIIVKLTDVDLFAIVVYQPPSYSENEKKTGNLLVNYSIVTEVALLDHFNPPSLKWESDLDRVYIPPLHQQFL